MKRRPIAAMAVWCIVLCCTSSAIADPIARGPDHPAWIKVDVARIRSGPGENFPIHGTRKKGTKVYVVDRKGEWVKVRTPGGFGWIHYELLTDHVPTGRKLAAEADGSAAPASQAASGDASPAWVKVDKAHVRSGPGLNYESYGTREMGTKVYVVGRKGDWAKVRTPGGFGWIRSDLLTDHVPTGQALARDTESSGGEGTGRKAFASGDNLYLRAGPGVNQDYRAVLDKGQTLYVTETQGDWCRVHVKGGNWGWVYSGYVKYADGASGTAEPGAASPPPTVDNFPSPTRQYTGAVALTETKAWVDEGGARVRYGAGIDYEVMAVLDRHTPVTVTDLDGHWCKVQLPDGSYGWMAGWILDFDGPGDEIMVQEGGTPVEVKVGWIARPEVNLRSGPSLHHDITGKATLSTQVVILERNSDWYRVGLNGGREAWVSANLVDTREQRRVRAARASSLMAAAPGPTATSVATDPGSGGEIVRLSMQYIGRPYSRGSSGEGGAFDCSGFVSYVFRQRGVRLARSSSAMFRQGGPVSRDGLRQGDCVFFRNTYRSGISHVGIYVGNGRFIHAANHSRGVVIDTLSNDYYAPRYAGAKRMH